MITIFMAMWTFSVFWSDRVSLSSALKSLTDYRVISISSALCESTKVGSTPCLVPENRIFLQVPTIVLCSYQLCCPTPFYASQTNVIPLFLQKLTRFSTSCDGCGPDVSQVRYADAITNHPDPLLIVTTARSGGLLEPKFVPDYGQGARLLKIDLNKHLKGAGLYAIAMK